MALPKLSAAVLMQTSRPVSAEQMIPEHFYLRCWAVKTRDPEFLPNLLARYNVPSEEMSIKRDRFVAGSVVQWLGTKEGDFFYRRLRRSIGTNIQKDEVLRLWRERNIRMVGLNHGVDALTAILNVGNPEQHHELDDPERISRTSPRDAWIAEAIIQWLVSHTGRSFARECDRLIRREQERDTLEHHHRYNLGLLESL